MDEQYLFLFNLMVTLTRFKLDMVTHVMAVGIESVTFTFYFKIVHNKIVIALLQ